MRDVLGWRRKFGVLGPSTNTIVQPDFEMMRPPGVTNHYSRIFTPNAQAVSNDTFMAGTQVIGENTLEAVKSVMTCAPDYLVMGMSAVTFYGGAKGADAFQARVEKTAGVSISIGSHSCTAALKTYGGVKRIAILSPYYPVANEQVAKYFTDSGFNVVRDIYLQCKSWTAIAEVPPEVLREKLIELNGNGRDVDAIVQVGTNLSMVRLAAAAEMWLGKPVIAINTATYWHALRQNKIADKIPGLGRLLEEFWSYLRFDNASLNRRHSFSLRGSPHRSHIGSSLKRRTRMPARPSCANNCSA
jgi:maleate isomerase